MSDLIPTTPTTPTPPTENSHEQQAAESGKAGWALAWLLGVPLPILLIVYLISRC